MTALHCDPHVLAGILRERQHDYEFTALGSVKYYERVLEFGAWLTGLKAACAYGVWMKALKAAGWSYSICNRAMKLHRLGVSAVELALKGAKAVFKEYARPRRPAADDEARVSAGAKFGPSPELPSGVADDPSPERGEPPARATTDKPAPAPERAEAESGSDGTFHQPQPDLDLPEVPVPPPPRKKSLLEDYNHNDPAHRILFCLSLTDLKLPARVALAIHSWRHGKEGWGGSIVSNGQIAALLGIEHHKTVDGRKERDHRSEGKLVRKWLKQAERKGYLRKVPRKNEASFHITFPDGPPIRRQLELVLMRTFSAEHQASAAEAAEAAVARAQGGHTAPPGGSRQAARGDDAAPLRGAATTALTEEGTRKGTLRGGRRMTAAEVREAEIDEAVGQYLRDTA